MKKRALTLLATVALTANFISVVVAYPNNSNRVSAESKKESDRVVYTTENEQVKVNFIRVTTWETGSEFAWEVFNKTEQPLSDWTISFDSEDTISSMWDINNQSFDAHHVLLSFFGSDTQVPAGSSKNFGGITAKNYGEQDRLPENIKVNGEVLGELHEIVDEVENVQKFDRKRIQMVTELNQSSVIDISESSSDIILNQDTPKDSQVWSFILDKVTDSYTIQTTDTTKGNAFLSEDISGNLNLLHAPTSSSYWKVIEVSPYVYQLVNLNSGHVIDVPNAETNDGTIIQTTESSHTLSQYWKFEILGGLWTEGSEKPENESSYTIRSASNPNLFLHNTGSKLDGGIQLFSAQEGKVGQVWTLDTGFGDVGPGVVLKNDFTYSGKYLSRGYRSNLMGISNGVSPEDFLTFIELSNGNYLIYSSVADAYFDAGAPSGNGSPVTFATESGQTSQQWVFEKVK